LTRAQFAVHHSGNLVEILPTDIASGVESWENDVIQSNEFSK